MKRLIVRSVNYRATQNKNNIGTTALERSVVYPTGGLKAFHCTNFTLDPDIILNTKILKRFGSHNGFLTQYMYKYIILFQEEPHALAEKY